MLLRPVHLLSPIHSARLIFVFHHHVLVVNGSVSIAGLSESVNHLNSNPIVHAIIFLFLFVVILLRPTGADRCDWLFPGLRVLIL